MIINAHLVSDLILATKQEPHSYENDINSEMKSEALQHLDKLTEEDCNNNLNNMSNRNIQMENKMFKFQQSKQETNTRYDEFKSFHSNNNNNNNRHNQLTRCTGCQLGIEDKYVFNLMNTYWHEECLQCSQCRILLKKTCFYKNGLLFCKDDYLKQFGTRCNACFELLNSNELVMRFFINNIGTEQQQLINYHLNCFKCIICDSLLQKGDEFVLKNEGIYCKNHYDFHTNATSQHSTLINRLNSKTYPYHNNTTNSSLNTTLVLTEEESSNLDLNSNTSSLLLNSNNSNNHRLASKQTTPRKSNTNRRITKRPRTILNAVQRYDFREAFKQSPKPCRKVREHLASKTGLTVRVVQVWFQNERAKVKKMQRRQQQHLLNQKLNGKSKCGTNSKMNTKNKKLKKSLNNNKNHRKIIDSDSMITNDEENSLANAANEDEDDYDDYEEDDSEQQSTDDELYSDDELDEEEEEEEDDDDDDQDIGKLDQINTNNNNSGLNQSPNNITTNNNTSSSSSSSISSMNSDYTNNTNNSYNNNMHGYHHLNHQHQQQIYQQQQHFNQPPPQQMIHNPIDRLYSMQNAYFCSS